MASPLCEQCSASGLPILPVRYTVVPKAVTPNLPGWAGGDRVKSVLLSDDQHYALRTLREGYVYLYYEKNQRGSRQWECYSVGQDGSLRLQPTPKMAQPQGAPTFACSRAGHTNANLQFIVIEKPEKCGATWIAFSAHKWSDETLAEYTDNTKLRNARMQTVHPAQMASGAKHTHGALADQAAIEGVLEYAPAFNEHLLPHDALVKTFSKEDGSYAGARLTDCSTLTPWALRKGQAQAIAERMKVRAKVNAHQENKAHVLALWDAIGIAHELNGYRNDAAGWTDLYGSERELQITAANAIDGLKQALDKKITEGWDQVASNTSGMPDFEEDGRRMQAATRYAKGDPAALGRPLYELDERFKAGQIDMAAYKAQRSQVIAANSSNPAAMEAEYAKIDQHRSELASARAKNLASNKQGEMARTWSKYQDRIDPNSINTFKGHWSELQTQANKVIDQRTLALVNWLEASLFIDTLEDFHHTNAEDGVLFQDAIGEAIFGMSASAAGARKVEAWVKEAKATVKSNLVWRVIALNSERGAAELDSALQEAQQHKGQQTLASQVAWAGYTAKSLKAFADTYKKAQGVLDGNARAATPAGTAVFGARLKAVNMRGVDKVAITVGEAAFRHFRIDKLGDYASEKIIQHIFSIRAFVKPADSANLILAQAKVEGALRQQTLQRLRTARAFMAAGTPEIKTAQAESLRAAWGKFRVDDPRAMGAIRDARLAVVVGLIEGMNFAKLLADCKAKGDMKSYFSLLASGMSITSALFDVASVPAKVLFGDASAWTYQRLKLFGGVLSGGSAFIGAVFDAADAVKNSRNGYGFLAVLFGSKALLGGASGVLTLAVTFTYSAPLISRITGRAALGTAVELVGERAAAIIGFRILGMAAGGWITVGLFGLQIVIWQITPDALEVWVDHCAFGKKRQDGGYKTSNEQQKKLNEALVSIGLQ